MTTTTRVWDPLVDAEHYRNPIIHADYSDPDVIAVGDHYYMVASSFNHVPGLPILHSTDLVHWTIINHVIAHYPDKKYDKPQLGCGAWAPSIRYYDGLFWVFFALPDEGIFQCSASEPSGVWSSPHKIVSAKGWIDPCPFWDEDGRCWLIHAFAHSRSGKKHQLQLCEMTRDATCLLDNGSVIYDGAIDCPTLEGPKLYKRNQWYYIFAPAGGVGTGWQCVLRSRSLFGPYETKVVLEQGATAINGPHQGGWVHTSFGEDWFIHFQDKGYLGRVVHLQPMHWQDNDWPIIGQKAIWHGHTIGQPVSEHVCPQTAYGSVPHVPQINDDFRSDTLGLQWQWQANPQPQWYQLCTTGLQLNAYPLPTSHGQSSLYDAPNLLLAKFPSDAFFAQTMVTEYFIQDGDMAGLIVYGTRYAALTLRRSHGCHYLVLLTGWLSDSDVLHPQERLLTQWTHKSVVLRVKQINSFCWFGYAPDKESAGQWLEVPFICSAGKWVGAKTGLFAVTEASSCRGYAIFDDFRVNPIT